MPSIGGAAGGATTLDSLTDVNTAGVANTNVLAYFSSTSLWGPAAAAVGGGGSGMNFADAWVAGTYPAGSMVTYQGRTWVATVSTSAAPTLPTADYAQTFATLPPNDSNPWSFSGSVVAIGATSAFSGLTGLGGLTTCLNLGPGGGPTATLTKTFLSAGTITFASAVSSEGGWDIGRFYIDGVQQYAISGSEAWTARSFAVAAGTHTFVWNYSKDGSGTVGLDTHAIGNVVLAGTGTGGTVPWKMVGLDDEVVRDTMSTALVPGSGITITPNDIGDTITIAAAGGVDAEGVRDTMATALVQGTGITITPNDVGDTITIAATGGGGGGGAQSQTVRQTITADTATSAVTGAWVNWPGLTKTFTPAVDGYLINLSHITVTPSGGDNTYVSTTISPAPVSGLARVQTNFTSNTANSSRTIAPGTEIWQVAGGVTYTIAQDTYLVGSGNLKVVGSPEGVSETLCLFIPTSLGVSGSSGTPVVARRTAGNVTTTVTGAWTDVDTALDLVVPAVAGDIILLGMSVRLIALSAASELRLDAVTMVSGAGLNSVGFQGAIPTAATFQGVLAWRGGGFANADHGVGGVVPYIVQAGDVVGGNVTFRLRYRSANAANIFVSNTPDNPMVWFAQNTKSVSTATAPTVKPTSLHATYGDDFTAASLNAKWSRVGYVVGDEQYAQGAGTTFLQVDIARAATNHYFQTVSGLTDFTLQMGLSLYLSGNSMFGLEAMDGTGLGVGCAIYPSTNTILTGSMTGAAYDSSFSQGPGSMASTVPSGGQFFHMQLNRTGTAWKSRYSLNGVIWSRWTATITKSVTVTKIGFGSFYGTPDAFAIDYFNFV